MPPGNEEALAERSAKRSPMRRGSMRWAMAGRALVEKEFSWRAATDRLLNVYGELLERRNSL